MKKLTGKIQCGSKHEGSLDVVVFLQDFQMLKRMSTHQGCDLPQQSQGNKDFSFPKQWISKWMQNKITTSK